MKKIICLLLPFFFMLVGCSRYNISSSLASSSVASSSLASSSLASSSLVSSKNINFYTIYNDFVFPANYEQEHDNKISLLDDNYSWNKFLNCNKDSFTGAKLPTLSLYGRLLICIQCYPAKSTYLPQWYIDHIALKDDTLTVYLKLTGVVGQDDTDNNKYGYDLILATVDYSDIPRNVNVQMELK